MSRPATTLAVLSLLASPLTAQDADFFGSAVAFSGSELLVVKRAPARGPAAVHVFRSNGSEWTRVGELRAPNAVERGLALSAAIATVPGASTVLVGSGDPDRQWGAHVWRRVGETWTPGTDIAVGSAPTGPSEVSLATVLQVLQPEARTVAAHGTMALVGFRDDAHLFRRAGDGWSRVALTGERSASFGSAVALGGDVGFIGVPRRGAGAVVVATPGADGWTVTATLMPTDLPASAFYGAAIALDGTTLAVGAPRGGAGLVIVYARRNGAWIEEGRVTAAEARLFGSAIALRGEELLVGAPGTATVYRFVRENGTWTRRGQIDAPAAGQGGGFGASIAIGDPGVAVGAPGAVGGRGRAFLFPRSGSGFGAPVELGPDPGPQTVTGGEVACQDGRAGMFRCSDVHLSSFLSIETLGGQPGERVSDLWGWTDPTTGREYALVGRTGALVFVDITDPTHPRVVGEMPANPSGARDIKVYRDHAFLTGDGAGQHGLMVFDLTRLRGVTTPQRFTPDTVYRGIASAHNLAIDTVAAIAVPVAASSGGETCGGGLHLIDIRNPKAPVFAGCYTDTEGLLAPGRTHDTQCVTYSGPDVEHRGRSICFAANETALRIVDVTDRANPKAISRAGYPGQAYIHQGWLTEDQRYYYLDDELDELVGTTDRTRTLIFDVSDLDDPVMVGSFLGPDGATDHNLYIKGNRMYQANYQAGLRIWDITDRLAPVEVGHFDTTPYEGNAAGFYGAWTAWPWFESGTVIVSSMQEGLFLLKPRPAPLIP